MAETAHPICQNCGEHAPGRFCAACGQSTNIALPTVWGFVQEAAGAIFSYDHKLWTTLRTLVLQPGQLTVDYIAGKRARYLAPFQLMLWLEAIAFLARKVMFDSNTADADRQAQQVFIVGAFFAVTLATIHVRRRLPFLLHFIAALHLWAFLMVLLLVEYLVVPWITQALISLKLLHGTIEVGAFVTHSVEIMMFVYAALAIRRIYQTSLLKAFVKMLLLFAAYYAFVRFAPL
jgi:hypothetical protein